MTILKGGKAGSLARFRFMANFVGIMALLLWLVYLPIKLTADGGKVPLGIYLIAAVHGYSYIVYIIVTFNYCLSAKKSLSTMVLYVLAGIFPVATFIADRRAKSENLALNNQ